MIELNIDKIRKRLRDEVEEILEEFLEELPEILEGKTEDPELVDMIKRISKKMEGQKSLILSLKEAKKEEIKKALFLLAAIPKVEVSFGFTFKERE